MDQLREFLTKDEAIDWMVCDYNAGEDCIDNERFAFEDDAEQMGIYEEQQRNGCCGSSDQLVLVNGRRAWVGCNYGH